MDINMPPTEEQRNGVRQAALQQLKSGANWFYWIAGLSIVNSLIAAFGGDMYFVMGLGLNHLVTGIIYGFSGVDYEQVEIGLRIVVFFITILTTSPFIVFGYFANKQNAWAFITGMVLYALDGLIFLIISDFLSIAFHALALFWIYKGYSASKNLKKLEMEDGIAQSGLAQPIK